MSLASILPGRSSAGAGATAAAAAERRRELAAARLEPVTVCRGAEALLDARVASDFVSRLRGLHALPRLGATDALLLRPCRAVHAWRMRYAIDALFLAADGTILGIRTLEPGASARERGARMVLETAGGTAARLGLAPGQRLRLDGEGRS